MKTKTPHTACTQNDNRDSLSLCGLSRRRGAVPHPPSTPAMGEQSHGGVLKCSSKIRKEILSMGNYRQLSGSPHWVLRPNLAPDCKTPVGAGTADGEEVFTRDAELVPFARQHALSVHQGGGVWPLFGPWPHPHPCFILPDSSMNEPGGHNKRAHSPRHAPVSDLFQEGVCVTSGRWEPACRLDAWLSESPNKAFPTTGQRCAHL